MAPARQAIVDACVFDSAQGVLRPRTTLVVEGDSPAAVTDKPLQVDDVARTIDAGGRVVLPGLIDAHVHVLAASRRGR